MTLWFKQNKERINAAAHLLWCRLIAFKCNLALNIKITIKAIMSFKIQLWLICVLVELLPDYLVCYVTASWHHCSILATPAKMFFISHQLHGCQSAPPHTHTHTLLNKQITLISLHSNSSETRNFLRNNSLLSSNVLSYYLDLCRWQCSVDLWDSRSLQVSTLNLRSWLRQ